MYIIVLKTKTIKDDVQLINNSNHSVCITHWFKMPIHSKLANHSIMYPVRTHGNIIKCNQMYWSAPIKGSRYRLLNYFTLHYWRWHEMVGDVTRRLSRTLLRRWAVSCGLVGAGTGVGSTLQQSGTRIGAGIVLAPHHIQPDVWRQSSNCSTGQG